MSLLRPPSKTFRVLEMFLVAAAGWERVGYATLWETGVTHG